MIEEKNNLSHGKAIIIVLHIHLINREYNYYALQITEEKHERRIFY